jgi:hypothetical protein
MFRQQNVANDFEPLAAVQFIESSKKVPPEARGVE